MKNIIYFAFLNLIKFPCKLFPQNFFEQIKESYGTLLPLSISSLLTSSKSLSLSSKNYPTNYAKIIQIWIIFEQIQVKYLNESLGKIFTWIVYYILN